MSYRVRGFNAAYYLVTESNSYKDGHSDIVSSSGMVMDGQRMTVVLAREPPPGARQLPGFLGSRARHLSTLAARRGAEPMAR
jgi:hypothetical protein